MSADEWEYEYSPHETENLYFTLDLTTHVSDALGQAIPSQLGKASRNLSAPRSDPTNGQSDSSEDEEGSEEENDLPKLQILDLETSNPLIKFEEGVYSCYWTTDLGTQFHIARAGETPDPLRKGTVLDVLGITRARLLGKPVQLIDRNAPNSAASAKTPSKVTIEDDEGDEEFVTTSGPLKIPKSILKTATSKSQAAFLTRLSEIKARKGERDQVPIMAVKNYNAPANAEAIKRKAEDDDRNTALVTMHGKKRRRRRRPMGVFPRIGNNAGRKGREEIERGLGLLGDQEAGEGRGVEDVGPSMFGGGEAGSPGDANGSERYRYLAGPYEDTPSPGSNPNQRSMAERKASEREYLSYQSRADYIKNFGRESSPPDEGDEMQPERPPWVARAEDEQGGERDTT